MNVKAFVERLVEISREDRTKTQKIADMVFGALFFIWIVPVLLVWIGDYINKFAAIPISRNAELLLGAMCALIGLFMLIWSVRVLWKQGEGTPSPLSPTRKLVVEGPFKYTRNPMQLGLLFYFFGLGNLLSSLTSGIFAFFFVLIFATLLNGVIEEKELLARFGDEYVQYHQSVPFLIPWLWNGRKRSSIKILKFRRKSKKAAQ